MHLFIVKYIKLINNKKNVIYAIITINFISTTKIKKMNYLDLSEIMRDGNKIEWMFIT